MNNRQLQHGHSLAFSELRHEHVASVWKFNRIMVTMRNIRVYRAEFSYAEIGCSRPKGAARTVTTLMKLYRQAHQDICTRAVHELLSTCRIHVVTHIKWKPL